MDEFLEKVFEAAFKREFDQDDNIVRSLPFFATALGLVVAIFSQVIVRLPPPSSVAGVVFLTILAVATGSFLNILWCLFQIVRARDFKLPPNEEKLLEWSDELMAYHTKRWRSAKKAEDLAIKDVRRRVVEAYAEAAVDNRASNRHKFRYRAQGFVNLVLLIALASASVGVIFIDKQWRLSNVEASAVAKTDLRRTLPAQGRGGTVRVEPIEAQRAAGSNGTTRGQIPLRSRGEELGLVRQNNPTAAATASPASRSTDGAPEEKRHRSEAQRQ